MTRAMVWSSDDEFSVDDVRYVAAGYVGEAHRDGSEQMLLLKPRAEIEGYAALIDTLRPRRIVELGIYHGGSTALLAQLAQPDKLVAIDLREGCPPLEWFIDSHGLRGVVTPHYGVDQTDVEVLDEIMANELGGAPADLIIDDASHLLAETRTSFNRLFPHLRPGGCYVIEDWGWSHRQFIEPPDRYQGVPPLSAFICELVLAAASRPLVISEVTVDPNKVIVRRGPRDLHPGRFDVSAHVDPVARDMIERLAPVRTLTFD